MSCEPFGAGNETSRIHSSRQHRGNLATGRCGDTEESIRGGLRGNFGRPPFRENEIDETVLPTLTAEDLKELGVTALGHRRKLLDPNGKQIGTKPRQ